MGGAVKGGDTGEKRRSNLQKSPSGEKMTGSTKLHTQTPRVFPKGRWSREKARLRTGIAKKERPKRRGHVRAQAHRREEKERARTPLADAEKHLRRGGGTRQAPVKGKERGVVEGRRVVGVRDLPITRGTSEKNNARWNFACPNNDLRDPKNFCRARRGGGGRGRITVELPPLWAWGQVYQLCQQGINGPRGEESK